MYSNPRPNLHRVSPEFYRRRLLQLADGLGVSGLLTHATGLDDSVLDRVRCGRRIAPDWTYRPAAVAQNVSKPTLLDEDLFVTPGFGFTAEDWSTYLVRLNATTGSEHWRFENEQDGIGLPRITDGIVYVGTGSDRVYALDAGSGTKLWTYSAGGEEVYGGGAWGRPAVVEDTVVVGISHSDSTRASSGDPSAFTHRVVGPTARLVANGGLSRPRELSPLGRPLLEPPQPSAPKAGD
ncbi:MAG: PQQ-binding-like beta-propeller repeat protein [Halobaculum sp.]